MTWTLHEGDCLDIMREMPDASVDAVITDPPFFTPAMHYQSRVDWSRKWSDLSVLQHWWGMMLDEFVRLTKPTGHCVTFCGAESFAAFYPPTFNRFPKSACLVWDKDRPGLGRIWRHQHELIIAARKADAFEPDDGRLRADVIRMKATRSADRQHPVEKPRGLLAYLIEATTPSGGIVLDPFAGSGTTLEAAEVVGRNSIGCEMESHYCAIIRRRMENVQGVLL